jgi:hypothetical protein
MIPCPIRDPISAVVGKSDCKVFSMELVKKLELIKLGDSSVNLRRYSIIKKARRRGLANGAQASVGMVAKSQLRKWKQVSKKFR